MLQGIFVFVYSPFNILAQRVKESSVGLTDAIRYVDFFQSIVHAARGTKGPRSDLTFVLELDSQCKPCKLLASKTNSPLSVLDLEHRS